MAVSFANEKKISLNFRVSAAFIMSDDEGNQNDQGDNNNDDDDTPQKAKLVSWFRRVVGAS